MKLLLDQNLSRKILPLVSPDFPDSRHVAELGMERAEDDAIWDYAIEHEFVILTKDQDFLQKSILLGNPPKIIHLGLGNCPTAQICSLLLNELALIQAFGEDEQKAYLLLS